MTWKSFFPLSVRSGDTWPQFFFFCIDCITVKFKQNSCCFFIAGHSWSRLVTVEKKVIFMGRRTDKHFDRICLQQQQQQQQQQQLGWFNEIQIAYYQSIPSNRPANIIHMKFQDFFFRSNMTKILFVPILLSLILFLPPCCTLAALPPWPWPPFSPWPPGSTSTAAPGPCRGPACLPGTWGGGVNWGADYTHLACRKN